jgi:transglutaminase-like putative cysteine protease
MVIFIALSLLCDCAPTTTPSISQIDKEEKAGNFTEATRLINAGIAGNQLSEEQIYELAWRKEKMHRIRLEFDKDKAEVLEYIRKYYPDVDDAQLAQWEAAKSLECMMIDGKKKYFESSAPNLFRIDSEAAARKREVDRPSVDRKEVTLQKHLPEVVACLSENGQTQAAPVRMKVTYSVTLKPDAVPDGEVVRCWLPYPREDNRRQSDVRLLAVNDDRHHYILSPASCAHRTLYMEKTARKGEPLTFGLSFSYLAAPEWFHLAAQDVRSYDTNSELYRAYTAERPPHIVFSDSIRALSQRIIGDETRIYEKIKRLFACVDAAYPWASSRDYSTIDNIPEYVMEHGHGDCGQVSLLFIALARYNGIPARWQSGFMMHPNSLNLHDWSEYYIEGLGWVPMDESFGVNQFATDDAVRYFYSNGIDAYRWIVNSDYSQPLYPAKIYPRSDDMDFQRGELEWKGGNLYYDCWDWDFDVSYTEE